MNNLLVRDGTSNRRICGVWTLPDGYLGRTGNQIIQGTVQQYLADRINYAYIAPPSILDAGQTLHRDSTNCPNGLVFPRNWTFGEHLSVRSHNEQREFLSAIAERKSIPRLIVAAWFWERGDVLVAALEKTMNRHNNASTMMVSSLLSSAFFNLINGKSQSNINNAAALEAIASDREDVIFLHIRYGDLMDYAIRRELLRRQGSINFKEWVDIVLPDPDSSSGKLIEEFDKDMRNHQSIFGPNRYEVHN